MFNVSLSERLKAAVNQLEATGTSLQARAQAGLQAQQAQSSQSQSDLPNTARSRTVEPTSPGRDKTEDTQHPDGPLSPRSAAFSPGHLAEGALSGLRGIRGSFNFSRTSLDGQRPSTTTSGEKSKENGLRELQDLPTTPSSPRQDQAGPSRPQSPARILPSFQLGSASDPSSSTHTPFLPRSPPGPSHLRLRSPSPRPLSLQDLPQPNPDDPASYPLPPSPVLRPSPLLQPTPQYADPLGASPVITPTVDADVPVLGVEAPTPEVERQADELLKQEGVIAVDAEEKVDGTVGSTEAENGSSDGPTTTIPQSEPTESIASTAIKKSGGDDTGQLQTQILAADEVLRSLTPLEGGIADAQALEGWVRMMVGKVEMMGEEMQRLQGKLTLQDSRMEELRDTHRLEGSSQTDLITNLRSQLSSAETALASQTTDLSALPQLRTDLQKAQTQIKEEEEKRTKAISLLKTVRLKLVKAEKDKEEVEKDRAEERAERSRALEEVERVKADREREVTKLRQGFERELQGVKDRAEREMKEKKGAWELEMITTKAAHAKELTSKTTMVNGLEAIVKELNATKDEQFHTIQSRQAEAENARADSETLLNRTKELEFQLREANERITLLEDTSSRMSERGRPDLLNGDRYRASPSPSPSRSRQNSGGTNTSASELQRLLAEAEARAEAKLSDLRHRIRSLEKERNDQEEEFGQKLQERVFELEKLKRMMQEKAGEVGEADRRIQQESEKTVEESKKREKVEKDIQGMMARLEEAKEDVATAQDGERIAKDELSQIKLQLQTYNLQLEEQKQLVQNLRAANKTLREELRKVQSSVQLMERSRNPGVGYWSASNGAPGASSSATTPSVMRSGEDTPILEGRRSMDSTAPSEKNGAPKGNEEEEVNLEIPGADIKNHSLMKQYLRNVILQFLENPQMRRQLVQVLSVILHFTPQELRRLNAKITA